MSKFVVKKAILFIEGFCLYMAIECCFRGYSYPLSGIMGGLCVVILDRINDELSWDTDLVWQALCGSMLVTMMELVVGSIAKYTKLLPVMWDYSSLPLNYDGVICLPFSVLWLFMSIAAIFLADAINYYVFEDTDVPYYRLFGKIVITFHKKKCDM